MNDADRQTRSYLMDMFAEHGFHPRSDLGQNFLIDLNLIEFVVREAELGPNDVALEIGAGTGGMTTFLAREAGAVVSVEIDPNMHAFASRAVAACPNVALLQTDALRNKNHFAPQVLDAVAARLAEIPGSRLKLIANLPYSVATPVISNLAATDLPWERMVVTIQWELAERMAAKPSTSPYGSLAVWLQSQCRVKILRRLPPNVFWPRPKVNSAIVKVLPDAKGRGRIDDRAFFQDFIRRLFGLRRKRLRSTLVGMYRNELSKEQVDALLAESGHAENSRAEQLAPAELVDLSNRFRAAIPRGTGADPADPPELN